MSAPPSDVLSNPKPKSLSRSVSAYAPLLLPLLLFPLSSLLTIAALMTLPLPDPLPTRPTPNSLSLIVNSLADYAQIPSYTLPNILPSLHLFLVLTLVTCWKHAWSIPGAVLLNVIAGGVYGGFPASLLMILLTALGSLASTIISRPLHNWILGAFPRAIKATKAALDSPDHHPPSSSPSGADRPWVRLALFRLVGIVPWSGINIASGIVRLPLADCFLGALIGCAPWTAVTCQLGDILNSLGADPDQSVFELLKTWDVALKLVFLTLLSLLPIFVKSASKRWLQQSSSLLPTKSSEKLLSPSSSAPSLDFELQTVDDSKSWRWSLPPLSSRPRTPAQEHFDLEKR